jgi:hypothetical protein
MPAGCQWLSHCDRHDNRACVRVMSGGVLRLVLVLVVTAVVVGGALMRLQQGMDSDPEAPVPSSPRAQAAAAAPVRAARRVRAPPPSPTRGAVLLPEASAGIPSDGGGAGVLGPVLRSVHGNGSAILTARLVGGPAGPDVAVLLAVAHPTGPRCQAAHLARQRAPYGCRLWFVPRRKAGPAALVDADKDGDDDDDADDTVGGVRRPAPAVVAAGVVAEDTEHRCDLGTGARVVLVRCPLPPALADYLDAHLLPMQPPLPALCVHVRGGHDPYPAGVCVPVELPSGAQTPADRIAALLAPAEPPVPSVPDVVVCVSAPPSQAENADAADAQARLVDEVVSYYRRVAKATHVVQYVHAGAPQLHAAYTRAWGGGVTVVDVSGLAPLRLWRGGHVAQWNDCLLRARTHAQLVAWVDPSSLLVVTEALRPANGTAAVPTLAEHLRMLWANATMAAAGAGTSAAPPPHAITEPTALLLDRLDVHTEECVLDAGVPLSAAATIAAPTGADADADDADGTEDEEEDGAAYAPVNEAYVAEWRQLGKRLRLRLRWPELAVHVPPAVVAKQPGAGGRVDRDAEVPLYRRSYVALSTRVRFAQAHLPQLEDVVVYAPPTAVPPSSAVRLRANGLSEGRASNCTVVHPSGANVRLLAAPWYRDAVASAVASLHPPRP